MAARLLLTAAAATALVASAPAAGLPGTSTPTPTSAPNPRAATGTIAGRVTVVTRPSRRLASAGAYPGRVIGPTPDAVPSELQNVIVFVDAGPQAAPPMRVSIHQHDEAFVPHVVAVTRGSTVDFPNDDIIFHNVFSLSHHNEFDLGRYPRGRSKSRTFDTPGLIKVFCHLHSHMSALIRVFDHPYFAIPDASGAFTIPDVPAGTYRVTAWHERVGEVELAATVGGGATASLAFTLPLVDEE